MDDWEVVRRATDTSEVSMAVGITTTSMRLQKEEVEVQQARKNGIQQSKDTLDQEIEFVRGLMMKVTEKKTAAKKQRSSSKRKPEGGYKSAASGKLQHKVWKPGGMQKKNVVIDDQLHNKVWDLGRRRIKHIIRRS